jgi:uncharacterized small protein (DUF1192 family)
MIRVALILAAIGWVVVNAWGLIYAVAVGEGPHAGVHIVLLAASAVAAAALWRWKPKKKQPAEVTAGTRNELLADEIDRLQRELDEARKGRDFAEELLRQRPDPSQPS